MNSRPTLKTEIAAGVTTFLTMSYIVVVNPAILATEGTGMPFAGVMTATVLTAFLSTLAMGLYAKLPYAVAPGMGLNAFFTFSLVLGRGIPWQTALGMVFWSGALFVALSATPLRETIVRVIPKGLRSAAAAGIGMFLAFIGLKNAGLIAGDSVTLVKAGELSVPAAACAVGLVVSAALLRKKSPFAFLAGIAAGTLVTAVLGGLQVPEALFSAPDFSLLFALDITGAIEPALFPAILTLLMTDLFDSLSTFVGISQAAKLTTADGEPKNLRQGLFVDAFASLASGLTGTSPATAYIESTAGIEMGGRTGRTAVVTAILFLPCLFLAPLAGMIPIGATAPVLILVGIFMFRQVAEISLERLEDAVPAFLTIALIPLTFSITQGILWGFISHVVLYAVAGRRREIPHALMGLAAVSAWLLALEGGLL